MNDRNINKPTGNNTPKPDYGDKKKTSVTDKVRDQTREQVNNTLNGKKK